MTEAHVPPRAVGNDGSRRERGLWAFHSDTEWPGTIYLTVEQQHERVGGSPSAHALVTWIPEFVESPQQRHNLDKLAASERSERHLFVLLPGFTTAPFGATSLLWYDDVPLPTDPPRLPVEVTHVWWLFLLEVGAGEPAADEQHA